MSEAVENPTREFVLKPLFSAPFDGDYKSTVHGDLVEVIEGEEVERSEPYPHHIGAKRGQRPPRFAWSGRRSESESLASELLWRIGVTNEKHLKWLVPALAQTLSSISVGREVRISAQHFEEWAQKGIRLLAAQIKPQPPELKMIEPMRSLPERALETSASFDL